MNKSSSLSLKPFPVYLGCRLWELYFILIPIYSYVLCHSTPKYVTSNHFTPSPNRPLGSCILTLVTLQLCVQGLFLVFKAHSQTILNDIIWSSVLKPESDVGLDPIKTYALVSFRTYWRQSKVGGLGYKMGEIQEVRILATAYAAH